MPLSPTKNIDEVLSLLDQIIDECHAQHNKLGLFAALYRRTTQEVKNELEAGRFEDPERLDRLDAVFANRYLQAYFDWKKGRPVSRSWKIAFEAARNPGNWMYQHMLLGMNAHINLDLGIATAEVAGPSGIHSIENDFLAINHILGRMVDSVQDDLAKVEPWVGWLDKLGGKKDEKIIARLIDKARGDAWDIAQSLCCIPPESWGNEIHEIDRKIGGGARKILIAGGIFNQLMWLFWIPEQFMLRKAIDHLRE